MHKNDRYENHERPQTRSEVQDLLQEALEDDLEPLRPDEALQKYLIDRRRNARVQTVRTHRLRLKWFLQYLREETGITNLNNVSSRDLQNFRRWRVENGDLNKSSVRSIQLTLRVFIRWCEQMNAVKLGLSDRIEVPVLDKAEEAREVVIEVERADTILEYLETYEYATRAHIVWLILRNTGMRTGALRAVDIEDYCSGAAVPHIELHHRPEATPLKNGVESERCVYLPHTVCSRVDDYLETVRPDVEDGEGRKPLTATQQGRAAQTTIARDLYRWSRPCAINQDCPHDVEPSECEAKERANSASRCPSSRSPHTLRRTYLSEQLRAGVPTDVVGARCDVTRRVLEIYYDQRDEEEKMERRKQQMEAIHQQDEGECNS